MKVHESKLSRFESESVELLNFYYYSTKHAVERYPTERRLEIVLRFVGDRSYQAWKAEDVGFQRPTAWKTFALVKYHISVDSLTHAEINNIM